MDCIIIHSNGWACSNKAERDARLTKVNTETKTAKRIHYIKADSVFNCVGSVDVGIQANLILNNEEKQFGWLCEVTEIKNGNIKAERIKELTGLEIKELITKIKK